MATARGGRTGPARTGRMPVDRDEVIRRLRAKMPNLRETYGVSYLGLFGSYVRGEARKTSDVDLLVAFERTPSLFEFLELEEQLSDLLGTKVDLVMRDGLKPNIGKRILSEVVSI